MFCTVKPKGSIYLLIKWADTAFGFARQCVFSLFSDPTRVYESKDFEKLTSSVAVRQLPDNMQIHNKHEAFTQCYFSVGPPSYYQGIFLCTMCTGIG